MKVTTEGGRVISLGKGYTAHVKVCERFLVQLRRTKNDGLPLLTVLDANHNAFISADCLSETLFGDSEHNHMSKRDVILADFSEADVESLFSILRMLAEDGLLFSEEPEDFIITPKVNSGCGLADTPKSQDRFTRLRTKMVVSHNFLEA